MIQADYHLHSSFSDDSVEKMEVQVQEAIRQGMSALCFTDHMDYDYPKKYTERFEFDVDAYFQEIHRLQTIYHRDISIRAGIELGMRPYLASRCERLVSSYPFDFVICSSHLIGEEDPYYPQYWHGKKEADSIRAYFDTILANLSVFESFDIYGHLDYVVRYAPSGIRTYSYEDYSEQLDAILSAIIKLGKGIELNTSGYRAIKTEPNPQHEVLTRYRELGGTIITIGSDAHSHARLGSDFSRAEKLLLSLGYDSYTVYENRTPVFLPLG